MIKDILIENNSGQTRLALLEDGELSEYYVERNGQEKLAGNIYLGRVENILPGMQAAFVNIGLDKNAFLHAGDILVGSDDQEALQKSLGAQSIKKMLKIGQEIMVQVIKEPGGTKGPRISSHVTLPGRMTVLLPTVEYIGISRRIEAEGERTRLREMAESLCPSGMGLIIRTAANGASSEELKQDIDYLVHLWNSVRQRAAYSTSPALIHRDESLVYRAVRDMLTDEVRAIYVDNKQQYLSVLTAAEMLSPELSERIVLYQDKELLFDRYRIDTLFNKSMSRRVWLKSGGYLVIDHTEALTVIDVNTGKFVGSKSLTDTIFKINCEAAGEIVRQLRLRDIGGIIIIDFIDMECEEDQTQLLTLMRQLLKGDRTKTNLIGLTGLGLVEMTRKKVHQPIHTLLNRQCSCCQGSGMIASDETVARQVLHELRFRAQMSDEALCWLVKTSAGVAGQLMMIGTSENIRAFVCVDAALAQSYTIEPSAEHMLPPKTRQIPKYV